MAGALEGLVVVALEQAVAAPLATSRLADAGARVIKLERPEGDFARHYDVYAAGHSSYFVWLNGGKESCRVDLSTEEDRDLVLRMLATADVFIQNLGPGATARLGLGSAALRRQFPQLITCDITGYAADTPHGHRKAYDLMIQAEAGLAEVTGTVESGPSRIGISICDIATGMTAHAQILEALIQRGITGAGSQISISLFDVAAELMSIPYIASRNGGPPTSRMGLAHPSIAPYAAFQTRDGLVLIAVQSEREWVAFCSGVLRDEALGRDPRFSSNSARVAHREEMDARISAVVGDLQSEELFVRLETSKIASARVSTIDDLARHSALARSVSVVAGATIDTIAPAMLVDGRRRGRGSVPELGEHDAALRREFAVCSLHFADVGRL